MNNMHNSTKISIVTEFIDELKSLSNSKRCLKLVISNFSVFDIENSAVQIAKDFNWTSKVSSNSEFELIPSNLLLTIKQNKDFEFGVYKLKIRHKLGEN